MNLKHVLVAFCLLAAGLSGATELSAEAGYTPRPDAPSEGAGACTPLSDPLFSAPAPGRQPSPRVPCPAPPRDTHPKGRKCSKKETAEGCVTRYEAAGGTFSCECPTEDVCDEPST